MSAPRCIGKHAITTIQLLRSLDHRVGVVGPPDEKNLGSSHWIHDQDPTYDPYTPGTTTLKIKAVEIDAKKEAVYPDVIGLPYLDAVQELANVTSDVVPEDPNNPPSVVGDSKYEEPPGTTTKPPRGAVVNKGGIVTLCSGARTGVTEIPD
jgi:hypothetical protein